MELYYLLACLRTSVSCRHPCAASSAPAAMPDASMTFFFARRTVELLSSSKLPVSMFNWSRRTLSRPTSSFVCQSCLYRLRLQASITNHGLENTHARPFATQETQRESSSKDDSNGIWGTKKEEPVKVEEASKTPDAVVATVEPTFSSTARRRGQIRLKIKKTSAKGDSKTSTQSSLSQEKVGNDG